MKRKTVKPLIKDVIILNLFILLFILAIFMGIKIVNAATTNSQYSYNFSGIGSNSTVANGAATNTGVNLVLYGNWTPTDFGVHFSGDTVSQQSVAYGKPTTGATINVSANQAVGVATKFKYQAPSGSTCFSDSPNITQIGKFAANVAQIKLQLTNCGKDVGKVFTQCRIAGANSTTNDYPVTGTQELVDGATYILKCSKAPDPTSGKTTLELKTVKTDPVNGNSATIDSFKINPPGLIKSTQYISVGQKYALPQISSNTDQFVGDVAKVAYCKAGSLNAVKTCLDSEIPE